MASEKFITIEKEVTLPSESKITLHFTYNRKLTLKEFLELLELTNRAINDFNRSQGVKSNSVLGTKYATKVVAVREGSFIVDLLMKSPDDIIIGLFVAFLYDQLKRFGQSLMNKKAEKEAKAAGVSKEELDNIIQSEYITTINVYGELVNIHINNGEEFEQD